MAVPPNWREMKFGTRFHKLLFKERKTVAADMGGERTDRERQRERQRETERDRERQRETERDRERQN
jgi:hypothetical protein